MSVSECCWAPYLFTLLTCGVLHMDTTAQQGSRVHEAEHALSPVGRVRCGAAREVGSRDLPFTQPLGGSFPGAAWR